LTRIDLTYNQITNGWQYGPQLIYDLTDYLDGNNALDFSEGSAVGRQVS
jgi:hypothetical protein